MTNGIYVGRDERLIQYASAPSQEAISWDDLFVVFMCALIICVPFMFGRR